MIYLKRFQIQIIFILWLVLKNTLNLKENNVYFIDFRSIQELNLQESYEQTHLISAISGIVNRNAPQFYYIISDQDYYFFFNFVQKKYFPQYSYTQLDTIWDAVVQFKSYFQGICLYDQNVYATSLLCSTLAGTQSVLPACGRQNGQVFQYFQKYEEFFPVKYDFRNFFTGNITGSTKNDVYYWAVQNLMDQINPTFAAYYIDYYWTLVGRQPYSENTVANHDFFIAKKGFFFDLYFWNDQIPNDDPNQPVGTDYNSVLNIFSNLNQQILNKYNESQMIYVGGFTPWAFKYLNGNHANGVLTEWQTVKILSSFNAFIDADACCGDLPQLSNGAFYQHYQLNVKYQQKLKYSTNQNLINKGYADSNGNVKQKMFINFYIGDYDSAAWAYNRLFNFTSDNEYKGKVPLNWAVNPQYSLRFPMIWDYIFENLSEMDYITSGDSGSGYINPTQIIGNDRQPSGYGDASKIWIDWNRRFYQQFDLNYTGFIIQGSSGQMNQQAEQLYEQFSPMGATLQQGYEPTGENPVHFQNQMPFFYEIDITQGNSKEAANFIIQQRQKNTIQFFVFRTFLQSPQFHYEIMLELQNQVQEDIILVNTPDFSLLAYIFFKK